MTREQTRQLGIEFERRIQEILPQTVISEKLDTDTIYSFLNEFQDVYIKQLYLAQDQIESGSAASNKIGDVIGNFIKTSTTVAMSSEDDFCEQYNLPEDYMLYVRSVSNVSSTYKSGGRYDVNKKMANKTVNQFDINSFIESFCNQGGILRNPIAIIENGKLKVFHDGYTKIDGIDVTYVRRPHPFNIMGFDDQDIEIDGVVSECEFPFSCFDDLVTGAVQLYVTNYKMMTQRAAQQSRDRRKEQEAE